MLLVGHNFAHVTTAELSWHVLNCDLIRAIFVREEQLDFLFKIWIMSSWTFVEIFPDFEINGSNNSVAFWIKYPTD